MFSVRLTYIYSWNKFKANPESLKIVHTIFPASSSPQQSPNFVKSTSSVHQEEAGELTWDAEGCFEKGPQRKSNSFAIVGNGFSQCIVFWVFQMTITITATTIRTGEMIIPPRTYLLSFVVTWRFQIKCLFPAMAKVSKEILRKGLGRKVNIYLLRSPGSPNGSWGRWSRLQWRH